MNTEKITALEKRWTELLKGPKKSDQTEIGRTKITAAELQHQLLQNEDYQKWLREKERVRIALEEAYAEDEKPLVEDLRQVGVDVKSVWNLVNTKSSYKSAIPVLLAHLPMQYHLKNKEGIIRALAVKEARGIACSAILEEYHKTPKHDFNYRWLLGNTMAVIITADYIEDVIAVVQERDNGESRQMFVKALANMKSPKIKDIFEQLLIDKCEVVNKEAQKALKKINRITDD
ncbi:HEAT repeat domain-containing protein [Sphingobacterium sp. HMA12]|uniref:HEAT repeat domain-containing protein n=1 Tax=Sphingobacterium sp. HMA12 TaxID=2050894 RepID=UPI001315A7A8|nr:HEAT repeat domain-containing protein [Sphingobacterium sp. HMA12]